MGKVHIFVFQHKVITPKAHYTQGQSAFGVQQNPCNTVSDAVLQHHVEA